MGHMNNRILHEVEHGKKLVHEGAEGVWNWASPTGQVRADRRAHYIVHVGMITKTSKVLEIGCGTGIFTKKVYDLSGADITAIDVSEDLLKIAREMSGVGKFILGDAMRMPFSDGTFDVVFGSSILHHLDFDASLREIYRVLKPGGRMVFAEPNMINPHIFLLKNIPFLKRAMGDSPDETAIVRWRFAKQMESIGFKKVKTFPYDFMHPITPNKLIGVVDRFGHILEKIPLIKEIAGSVIIFGEK